MAARVIHHVIFDIAGEFPPFPLFDRHVVFELEESCSFGFLKIPKKAYRFQFFDVQVATENDVEMKSSPFNFSPRYFCNGTLMTRVEAIQKMNDDELRDPMFIKRIEKEGWFKVFRTNGGIYRRFHSRDKVYNPDPDQI